MFSGRLLVLILCLMASRLGATDYYVSPGGSDFNPGSEANPFLTIQKAASVMNSGDVCHIASGTYREEVTPSSNNVTFIAQPGATAVVSGFEHVTNWTVHSGSIYSAQLSWDLGDENQLLYDGRMMTLARWPSKTNDSPFDLEAYKSSSGTTSSLSHPGIPNWNWSNGGVLFFLGKNRWTSWRRPITGSSAGSVSFDTLPSSWDYAGSHSPANGGEFFLQNILQALDTEGEWYTDSGLQKIYFWAPGGGSPANGTALVRRRTELFDLSGRSGITIDGLILEGGRIDLRSASNCTIRNCRIYFGNHSIASTSSFIPGGHLSSIQLNNSSSNNLIQRNDIQWGAGNGVLLLGWNNQVDNNYIGNFNYLASYACPVELANNNKITQNEIFNGGRDLVRRGGNGAEIAYNDLHHSNLINDDCGPIYICCASCNYTRIHHNWIHDCNSRDNNFTKYKATGVYLDNSTKQVIVDHNVFWNLEWACIQINWEGEDLLIYNNTLWSHEGNESKSMGRWVNGYSFINVQVHNTLANEGEFHYTSLQNTCVEPLASDPFEDFANRDFTPLAGTCPVDAGQVIPGYTDGYVGSAPDIGAYERGAAPWVAGPDWNREDLFDTPPMHLEVALQGSGSVLLTGKGLDPTTRYGIWKSSDLQNWTEVGYFTTPPAGFHETTETIGPEQSMFYRLTGPHIYSGTGLMTFSEFEGNAHNDHVSVRGVLTAGLPDGLTATIGGTSDGFGVFGDPISGGSVSEPALFVYGDGPGTSLKFNAPVEVPSLWTSAGSWALANDPGGEQKITGKLNGATVWTFTNTTSSTSYFEVTTGSGHLIDELVIYPKWIGVDNVTVEYPGSL